MNKHIVKVKAPRVNSSTERLELVLDPNWNLTSSYNQDTRDEEEEVPYPELTQSWSRHSYHSESTAETDNRSYTKVMNRTYSLESDGSYFSRTDFESDAYKEMEKRNGNSVESIDEEDELYYGQVEEEDDASEHDREENEYYKNLEKDVVSALENGLCHEEQGEEGELHHRESSSSQEDHYSRSYEEEDSMQYHVNNDACIVKDVGSPEEEEDMVLNSTMSTTFDDSDQQNSAMSPDSDVHDEVYEEPLAETPVSSSRAPLSKRGVSFDEETLSKQESTRSQERSNRAPLRRMPSEDTSVASVGYRVTTTVKQKNIATPTIATPPVKQRPLSPSILRDPKYASSASVASRGKENTPRRKQMTQEPKPILSPRGSNNTASLEEQPKPLSPTNDSMTSPDVASVHSHGSNVAVGRGARQKNPQRQLQQQKQREGEKQQRLRQLEENRQRLNQQQVDEEQERLRQEEQENKQRLQQQQLEEEQYREPLRSIDPIETKQDDDTWLQYNAIPRLARSPSGLSRFSEGVRSTVALDGFAKDKPKIMPKLSWFRARKQSVPITAAAIEVARPSSKTKLMKKFFGKMKKGSATEALDDSEVARHPLSSRDPFPGHDQAPLPQILTSDRPMRVHTAVKDWADNESVDPSVYYSHHSRQSVRSHDSRQSVESRRGNHVPTRPKVSQPQNHNGSTVKKKSKADHLKNNPWADKANDRTEAITIHDTTAPTNEEPDGAYNIDGAGMPSFKWWTWSQPDENGEQKDSRYCAMMCVFPPAADD
ncbi:hypothetical protein ACHAXN_011985 [Cyclotella atomus]